MASSIDIYADLVLTFEGDDIRVSNVEKDRIVVAFPTFLSGVRSVRRLLRHSDWVNRLSILDSRLKDLGLSVYLRAGTLSTPILGVKARRGVLPALIHIARLDKQFLSKRNLRQSPKKI